MKFIGNDFNQVSPYMVIPTGKMSKISRVILKKLYLSYTLTFFNGISVKQSRVIIHVFPFLTSRFMIFINIKTRGKNCVASL